MASAPTCTGWPTVQPARTSRTCTPSIPTTGPTSGSMAPIRKSRIRRCAGHAAFGSRTTSRRGDRDHRRLPDDPGMTDPAARPVRQVPVLIGGTEMAEIDAAAQRLGLSQDALMEAAGAAVTEVALTELGRLAEPARGPGGALAEPPLTACSAARATTAAMASWWPAAGRGGTPRGGGAGRRRLEGRRRWSRGRAQLDAAPGDGLGRLALTCSWRPARSCCWSCAPASRRPA